MTDNSGKTWMAIGETDDSKLSLKLLLLMRL